MAAEGFPVYSSDREAKRLVEEDPSVRARIIALLGEDAYRDGRYQAQYVASRVFDPESGPALLRQLNAIIHPVVREDILRWVTAHPKAERLYVESALLFESGIDKLCDQVICVTAPEEVCIARVIARDGVTEMAVRARMATQMSDEERRKRSDIIYENI